MSKFQKGESHSRKYLVLVLMVLSLCLIYVLPYLRYSYFTPLQEAMGLMDNTTAYGSLISIYGIMNVICYLPSGIIADKFDPKKLLVFSMVSSGLLGLWMSLWPPYPILMLIHILWGLTTVLTFWSSSVKCVNMLASSGEQGQMFGLLEGGRGLVGLGINAAFLGVFALLSKQSGGDVAGITIVVIGVSIMMIADGIALAFLLPKTTNTASTNADLKSSLKAMLKTFTLPITWALAGIIFACSAIAASASYYAPYLQGACGMTVLMASTFAILRASGTAIVAAPIAGALSKKMGRSSFLMIVACAVLICLYAVLRIIPGTNALLWPLIIVMILITFAYASNRAVYWAIIDEAGTPKNMVGSVIGVASLIGFLPDTFINTLFGSYLDNNEFSVAYGKIFTFCIGCAVLGLLVSILAERVIKKYKATAATVAAE